MDDVKDMADSIDLWGNLFTSSSIDEVSSSQALLLEALSGKQASKRRPIGVKDSIANAQRGADRRICFYLGDRSNRSDINSRYPFRQSVLVWSRFKKWESMRHPMQSKISTTDFQRLSKKQQTIRSNTSTSSQFTIEKNFKFIRGSGFATVIV